MADDKIDPALARLTPENYLAVFEQKGDLGYGLVWTSTCSTAPARVRIYSETEWTPMLRASITARYDWYQQTYRGYSYTQRLKAVGEEFGRKPSAVKEALKETRSLFSKSA